MFPRIILILSSAFVYASEKGSTESGLTLYSQIDPKNNIVVVKTVSDNLSLICGPEDPEDERTRVYKWDFIPKNKTQANRPHHVEPEGLTVRSILKKQNLQISDTGRYWCTSSPWSVSLYLIVMKPEDRRICKKESFVCGTRCVLPSYVCDGVKDCVLGEDETTEICGENVCDRDDHLKCSSGRCISKRSCCGQADDPNTCYQPSCCSEHPEYQKIYKK